MRRYCAVSERLTGVKSDVGCGAEYLMKRKFRVNSKRARQ